jgi:hypothetical protein
MKKSYLSFILWQLCAKRYLKKETMSKLLNRHVHLTFFKEMDFCSLCFLLKHIYPPDLCHADFCPLERTLGQGMFIYPHFFKNLIFAHCTFSERKFIHPTFAKRIFAHWNSFRPRDVYPPNISFLLFRLLPIVLVFNGQLPTGTLGQRIFTDYFTLLLAFCTP